MAERSGRGVQQQCRLQLVGIFSLPSSGQQQAAVVEQHLGPWTLPAEGSEPNLMEFATTMRRLMRATAGQDSWWRLEYTCYGHLVPILSDDALREAFGYFREQHQHMPPAAAASACRLYLWPTHREPPWTLADHLAESRQLQRPALSPEASQEELQAGSHHLAQPGISGVSGARTLNLKAEPAVSEPSDAGNAAAGAVAGSDAAGGGVDRVNSSSKQHEAAAEASLQDMKQQQLEVPAKGVLSPAALPAAAAAAAAGAVAASTFQAPWMEVDQPKQSAECAGAVVAAAAAGSMAGPRAAKRQAGSSAGGSERGSDDWEVSLQLPAPQQHQQQQQQQQVQHPQVQLLQPVVTAAVMQPSPPAIPAAAATGVMPASAASGSLAPQSVLDAQAAAAPEGRSFKAAKRGSDSSPRSQWQQLEAADMMSVQSACHDDPAEAAAAAAGGDGSQYVSPFAAASTATSPASMAATAAQQPPQQLQLGPGLFSLQGQLSVHAAGSLPCNCNADPRQQLSPHAPPALPSQSATSDITLSKQDGESMKEAYSFGSLDQLQQLQLSSFNGSSSHHAQAHVIQQGATATSAAPCSTAAGVGLPYQLTTLDQQQQQQQQLEQTGFVPNQHQQQQQLLLNQTLQGQPHFLFSAASANEQLLGSIGTRSSMLQSNSSALSNGSLAGMVAAANGQAAAAAATDGSSSSIQGLQMCLAASRVKSETRTKYADGRFKDEARHQQRLRDMQDRCNALFGGAIKDQFQIEHHKKVVCLVCNSTVVPYEAYHIDAIRKHFVRHHETWLVDAGVNVDLWRKSCAAINKGQVNKGSSAAAAAAAGSRSNNSSPPAGASAAAAAAGLPAAAAAAAAVANDAGAAAAAAGDSSGGEMSIDKSGSRHSGTRYPDGRYKDPQQHQQRLADMAARCAALFGGTMTRHWSINDHKSITCHLCEQNITPYAAYHPDCLRKHFVRRHEDVLIAAGIDVAAWSKGIPLGRRKLKAMLQQQQQVQQHQQQQMMVLLMNQPQPQQQQQQQDMALLIPQQLLPARSNSMQQLQQQQQQQQLAASAGDPVWSLWPAHQQQEQQMQMQQMPVQPPADAVPAAVGGLAMALQSTKWQQQQQQLSRQVSCNNSSSSLLQPGVDASGCAPMPMSIGGGDGLIMGLTPIDTSLTEQQQQQQQLQHQHQTTSPHHYWQQGQSPAQQHVQSQQAQQAQPLGDMSLIQQSSSPVANVVFATGSGMVPAPSSSASLPLACGGSIQAVGDPPRCMSLSEPSRLESLAGLPGQMLSESQQTQQRLEHQAPPAALPAVTAAAGQSGGQYAQQQLPVSSSGTAPAVPGVGPPGCAADWARSIGDLPVGFGPMSLSPAAGMAEMGMDGVGSLSAADLAAIWDEEEEEEDPAATAALLKQAAWAFENS